MGTDDTRRKLYSTVLVETGKGDRKAMRQRQRAARQVLANGLDLLGVSAPEKKSTP